MISDEEFIQYLREASEPEVRSTREVADYFGMSTQGAIKRLHELRDNGEISGKDLHGGWVWWVSEQD